MPENTSIKTPDYVEIIGLGVPPGLSPLYIISTIAGGQRGNRQQFSISQGSTLPKGEADFSVRSKLHPDQYTHRRPAERANQNPSSTTSHEQAKADGLESLKSHMSSKRFVQIEVHESVDKISARRRGSAFNADFARETEDGNTPDEGSRTGSKGNATARGQAQA